MTEPLDDGLSLTISLTGDQVRALLEQQSASIRAPSGRDGAWSPFPLATAGRLDTPQESLRDYIERLIATHLSDNRGT